MRKNYLIGGLGALLLAAAAGWYFASPWLTLRAMVSAAKANDAERLSAYVDYQALRRDVKADLARRLEAEAKKERGLAGRLGLAVGRAMIAPAVDAAVSPAALKVAFAAMGRTGAGGSEPGEAGGSGRRALPTIDRQGFGRFVLRDPAVPGAAFVFERRGLGWKLAGLERGPKDPASADRD